MSTLRVPQLCCVTHAHVSDTNAVLAAACDARGEAVERVLPDAFEFNAGRAPAGSQRAIFGYNRPDAPGVLQQQGHARYNNPAG